MAGDKKRAALPFLDVAEQARDLGADSHVQRRGGLVRQDKPGGVCQRARDEHPLAHPARKLVGVAVKDLFRRGQAHPAEKFYCPAAGTGRIQALMRQKQLATRSAPR